MASDVCSDFEPLDFRTPLVNTKDGRITDYWQRRLTQANRLLVPPDSQTFINNIALAIGSGAGSIIGTHAVRLVTTPLLKTGRFFYETDRASLYLSNGVIWQWIAGEDSGVLAAKPADLIAVVDVGFLYRATDYDRTYRWTGSAWSEINAAPRGVEWLTFAPETNGYALCDGSSTTRSKPDGTTAAITLPDLRGMYPRGASAYTGSQIAAVAPTFGSGTAASNGAHTHTAGIDLELFDTYVEHVHDIDHNHGGGVTGSTSAGTPAGTISGATSTGGGHDHGGVTGTGGAHNHGATLAVDASGQADVNFADCFVSNVVAEGNDDAQYCGHTHNVDVTGSATGTVDAVGDHDHTIAAEANHSHTLTSETVTFTGSALAGHTHTITAHAGNSGAPEWTNTEDIVVTVLSDGAHTHTVTGTVSDTGRPPTMELMPYFRL